MSSYRMTKDEQAVVLLALERLVEDLSLNAYTVNGRSDSLTQTKIRIAAAKLVKEIDKRLSL